MALPKKPERPDDARTRPLSAAERLLTEDPDAVIAKITKLIQDKKTTL